MNDCLDQCGRTLVLLTGALLAAAPAAAQPKEPTAYDRAVAAGYKAAFLCSGAFIAGRTQAQVEAVELNGIYPEYQALLPELPAEIDRSRGEVRVAFSDTLPPRRAAWHPKTGCTNMPIGSVAPPVADTPPTALKGADPERWPLGDAKIAPRPSKALAAQVAAAFDGRSYGDGPVTTATIVVQDGRIVAERYAEGFGPFTAQRTWSVAKSIAGTLFGIAAKEGLVAPDKHPAIAAWGSAPFQDGRATIKFDNLLRMASGLHSDTAGNRTDAIYFGGTAVTERATSWPLEAKPGVRFRYANNDILLAVLGLRHALGETRYAAFPHDALFAPLGMAHTVAETDWRGNFILSSQVWSTARDLARLGLLWLNDGVWQGERILPEDWMRYMTTPSGPQPEKGAGYGATLWLFGPAQGLPEGSFAAQGNRGQYVMVVPSKRLVIVRRGEDPAGHGFDIARFTADVIEAVE